MSVDKHFLLRCYFGWLTAAFLASLCAIVVIFEGVYGHREITAILLMTIFGGSSWEGFKENLPSK